jgi:hypothetical protein
LDSHPSSAAGATGWEQFPQPDAHCDVQRPAPQESVVVLELEHARLQSPQSAVVVWVFVSHPCDGSAVQ